MSYGFMAFSMDIDWLADNLGRPNNDKLHKQFLTSPFFKKRMKQLAVDFDLTFDEVAAKLREVTHPIAKGRERGHDGAVHFYLVEEIVKRRGESLDNSKFYPFGLDSANAFDKALTRAGVPKKAFRFDRFLTHSLPIRLPSPDDFPLVGYMSQDEVIAAAKALTKVRLPNKSQNDLLCEVRDWLWTAEAYKHGLVVFYH